MHVRDFNVGCLPEVWPNEAHANAPANIADANPRIPSPSTENYLILSAGMVTDPAVPSRESSTNSRSFRTGGPIRTSLS